MEILAVLLGIWGLVTYLIGLPSLDEMKRTLQGEADYFHAKMQDIQRKTSSFPVQRGKKRKRDDDLCDWMMKGKMLVEEAQHLINQIGSWRCLGAKVRWDAYKLLNSLKVHDTKGDMLVRQACSYARGPCPGYHIPVKQPVGQIASRMLDQLKLLLKGDEFGGIAICGISGIGKTFFMQHLHNWALTRFDYVFWVSFPAEFTIESVQNAIASVVQCDFARDDALSVRAGKLSDTLSKLSTVSSFAIFLDGVPKGNISPEQIGIPVNPVLAKGGKCKLVLSTRSTLDCRMFDSFKKIEITRLSGEDAYELFMHKANIGKESVTSLDGIPSLLAASCCGVPHIIENRASRICGINDVCEWRNALVELG